MTVLWLRALLCPSQAYSLHGEPAVSFADIARIVSDNRGVTVRYSAGSDEEYPSQPVAAGLPEPAAGFALAWVHGIDAGEWADQTGDLEKLIGHRPTTSAEFLRDNYPADHS